MVGHIKLLSDKETLEECLRKFSSVFATSTPAELIFSSLPTGAALEDIDEHPCEAHRAVHVYAEEGVVRLVLKESVGS